jgi:hypothetical protein
MVMVGAVLMMAILLPLAAEIGKKADTASTLA